MSYNFGNRTVKDGLVFYLDVENRLSYIPNNKEWKSIAKNTSIGYFNASNPPVFNGNLYDLGKKAIDFIGSNKAIVGQIGIDRLLNVNKTGTITVQIYFAVETLEVGKFIFASGWNGDGGGTPQYSVGISETNLILTHGEAGNRISISGNFQLKIFSCVTVSFGASTKVYIDNTYLGTHNIIPTIPDNQGQYWLVGYDPREDTHFAGGINAIRVYNRELTAAEVAESYNFFTQRS